MSSTGSPCAACKFLRQKCTQECVFAPYFPPDQPLKFANVHKVFGASNVSKILKNLNPSHREHAVNSLAYEAEARLKDPVYGCVGLISLLQQRLKQVHENLEMAKTELANYIGHAAMMTAVQPPCNQQRGMFMSDAMLPCNAEEELWRAYRQPLQPQPQPQPQVQQQYGHGQVISGSELGSNYMIIPGLLPSSSLSSSSCDNNGYQIEEKPQDENQVQLQLQLNQLLLDQQPSETAGSPSSC